MHYSNYGFKIIKIYNVSQFLKGITWIHPPPSKKKEFYFQWKEKCLKNKTLYPYLTLKIFLYSISEILSNYKLSTKVNFGQNNILFRFCTTEVRDRCWNITVFSHYRNKYYCTSYWNFRVSELKWLIFLIIILLKINNYFFS